MSSNPELRPRRALGHYLGTEYRMTGNFYSACGYSTAIRKTLLSSCQVFHNGLYHVFMYVHSLPCPMETNCNRNWLAVGPARPTTRSMFPIINLSSVAGRLADLANTIRSRILSRHLPSRQLSPCRPRRKGHGSRTARIPTSICIAHRVLPPSLYRLGSSIYYPRPLCHSCYRVNKLIYWPMTKLRYQVTRLDILSGAAR
jgi:hypothetical protein